MGQGTFARAGCSRSVFAVGGPPSRVIDPAKKIQAADSDQQSMSWSARSLPNRSVSSSAFQGLALLAPKGLKVSQWSKDMIPTMATIQRVYDWVSPTELSERENAEELHLEATRSRSVRDWLRVGCRSPKEKTGARQDGQDFGNEVAI